MRQKGVLDTLGAVLLLPGLVSIAIAHISGAPIDRVVVGWGPVVRSGRIEIRLLPLGVSPRVAALSDRTLPWRLAHVLATLCAFVALAMVVDGRRPLRPEEPAGVYRLSLVAAAPSPSSSIRSSSTSPMPTSAAARRRSGRVPTPRRTPERSTSIPARSRCGAAPACGRS